MSPDAFTRECAAFGWADPVATEYPPDDQPAMHAHDFDATVLVLEGELQMTFEDRVEVLAPGEKCVVAAGTQHSEQTGAAGARGLLATRANRTAAAGGGPKAAEGSTVDGATVEEVSEAYDGVAELYAELFLNQLDHVEIDRNLIRSFADRVGPGARVLDAGCGPGHVTAHLDHLGLDAVGVDSAAAMIGIGQREFRRAPSRLAICGRSRLPMPRFTE